MFLAAGCKTGRKLWSNSLLLGSGCLSPMLIAPLLGPPATIGTANDRSWAEGRCAKRTRYRPLNPPALIQLTVCRNADPSEADPTTDRVAMGRKRRHLVFLTAGPVFQKLDQAR